MLLLILEALIVGGFVATVFAAGRWWGFKKDRVAEQRRHTALLTEVMNAADYWKDRAEMDEHKFNLIYRKALELVSNGESSKIPRYIRRMQEYIPEARKLKIHHIPAGGNMEEKKPNVPAPQTGGTPAMPPNDTPAAEKEGQFVPVVEGPGAGADQKREEAGVKK